MPNLKSPTTADPEKLPHCGIIMPISPIDGLSANHWDEVKRIIMEVAASANFTADMVNISDSVGLIHKKILQNLATNEIVICDVSANNPNVLFELGIRLTFDKPTVIIKDDRTDFNFDTGIIEHIIYPRDLRYYDLLRFKDKLERKLNATYSESRKEGYSAFLKHFGDFEVPLVNTSAVPEDLYMFRKMDEIYSMVSALQPVRNPSSTSTSIAFPSSVAISMEERIIEHVILNIDGIFEESSKTKQVKSVRDKLLENPIFLKIPSTYLNEKIMEKIEDLSFLRLK